MTVTPSVTNTTGYITGGTKTGTGVTVSASELVSGSQTITENGTVNVTNLASVVVDVPTGGGVSIFTLTQQNNGTFVPNFTYAEAYSAYQSGDVLLAEFDATYGYPLHTAKMEYGGLYGSDEFAVSYYECDYWSVIKCTRYCLLSNDEFVEVDTYTAYMMSQGRNTATPETVVSGYRFINNEGIKTGALDLTAVRTATIVVAGSDIYGQWCSVYSPFDPNHGSGSTMTGTRLYQLGTKIPFVAGQTMDVYTSGETHIYFDNVLVAEKASGTAILQVTLPDNNIEISLQTSTPHNIYFNTVQ